VFPQIRNFSLPGAQGGKYSGILGTVKSEKPFLGLKLHDLRLFMGEKFSGEIHLGRKISAAILREI